MPGTVQVMVWAVELQLATLPAKDANRIIEDVKNMYHVVAGKNVLATSMNNLNPVVPCVPRVMNADRIDSVAKDFHLYWDATILSISRGIKPAFELVSEVATAVGATVLECPGEELWRRSTIMSTYSRVAFDNEEVEAKISGPSSMKFRHIAQYILYGLLLIARLARKLNVSASVIDSVIHFDLLINQTTYYQGDLAIEELAIAK